MILSLLIIAATIAVLAYRQPSDFYYSRSLRMAAPAERIFPHVNNMLLWNAWSPWAKLDPNAKYTFSGPEAGVDSSIAWEGNSTVGKGTMTVTQSIPSRYVRFRLDFEKPMKATHDAEFTFTELEDGQTLVMWTMSGQANYFGKLIGLVMNCQKMMNTQFDNGLASLKAIVEAK